MSAYLDARKELVKDLRKGLNNLLLFKDLIDSFDESPDFEVTSVNPSVIQIEPAEKISAKQLSIMLDEILYPLPHVPTSESLDSVDLMISLGEYPNRYQIWVRLKDTTTCRIVEIEGTLVTYHNKTYSVLCHDKEEAA